MITGAKFIRTGTISGPITPLNELKIYPEPNSGCWLWIGSVTKNGYGKYWSKSQKKVGLAHRVVWESHFGRIKDGLEADHLCRTRCCVNPHHLELVTKSVNVSRGLAPQLNASRLKEKCGAITHCPKGHEYSLENTYIQRKSDGYTGRACRTCHRIRVAESKAKLKAGRCEV